MGVLPVVPCGLALVDARPRLLALEDPKGSLRLDFRRSSWLLLLKVGLWWKSFAAKAKSAFFENTGVSLLFLAELAESESCAK